MRISKANELKRYSKLPFKLIYLILCWFALLLSYLIYFVSKRLKKHKKEINSMKVICISNVAISFDGRIKKCANKIVDLGYDVTLIKPIDAHEDLECELSALNSKVRVKRIGLSGVFSKFPCVFDLAMFCYILTANVKYLHCHDINTAFMGLLAATLTNKILIADLHEWKSETTEPTKKYKRIGLLQEKFYRFCEHLVLKEADFVITVNEIIAEKMQSFYNIRRDIIIIKNMPEVYDLKPYNLREKLSIDPEFVLVYYVGQLAPYRNLEQILLAVSKCNKIAFVYQGTIQADYLKFLENMCIELKILDRVYYLPPVAHDLIPSVCQGADIGIFTCCAVAKSMFYALPNKLFEYVIGELPIIAEDIPVVKPYILENDIGTLVNSNITETIVEAFDSYIINNTKKKKQKENVIALKSKIINKNESSLNYKLIY